MIRLLLVACASTAATRRAAFPVDEPIDAQGAADAAALRASLPAPDIAVSSPALRARETAGALGLDHPQIEPELGDLDCGTWAGATLPEIEASDPDGFALWMRDAHAAPHGGESVARLCQRVRNWMTRFAVREGRATAVTHHAVMRAAIVVALAAPLEAFWRIDIAPLGRLTLHADAARWRLRAIEDWRAPKRHRA